jgi:hypothetical protein
VSPEDRHWMAYIDGEVRATCEAKGWGHQIRRKWSVREKLVSESLIEDYEWKLIPSAQGKLPDAQPLDYEGVYYVLYFDRPNRRLVFQHDTWHVGIWGPHWEVETYTAICLPQLRTTIRDEHIAANRPGEGWLRDHMLELIIRFGPNSFSRT